MVRDSWVPIDETLPAVVGDYVEQCARDGFAAYLLPAAVREGAGGLSGILTVRVLPFDFDTGDIDAKLCDMRAAIGEPWFIADSGSWTEDGQRKAHVYYRLASDVSWDDATAAAALTNLRRMATLRFGADTKVGGNPAQILRVPGSVNRKKDPRPARLRSVDNGAPLNIQDTALKLGAGNTAHAAGGINLNFNTVAPDVSVNRVLTAPIRAEGKDDVTRFDGFNAAAGHYLRNFREGRYTIEEARKAIHDWNVATLVPPWPPERIDSEFNALIRVDQKNYGPVIPSDARAPRAWNIKQNWSTREYEGEPPAQRWLVDGVVPLGEPGVVAGEGGVGKSFLALDLCLRVATGAPAQLDPLNFGMTESFGGRIVEFGAAVFITAEESKAALHRRLHTLDPSNCRQGKPLYVVAARDIGGALSLTRGKNEGFTPSAYAEMLFAELSSIENLRLVVIDPLATFFGGDINDRTAAQAFADVLNQIASATGATIIALHHMTKSGDDKGRRRVLGSGGFVDGMRFAYTLGLVDEERARKIAPEYGLPSDHGELVRGALVKANGGPTGDEHIYERREGGVLRQLPKRADIATEAHTLRLASLSDAVDWYAERGQPFTKTGAPGLAQNRQCLPPELRDLPERALARLAEDALRSGVLVAAAAPGEKKQKWLCKPGGVLAMGNLRSFQPGARPAWEAREG